MKEIWDYNHYKKYLEARLGSSQVRTGERKRLAESLGVHTTFVSQVMADRNHFSLEQAEACNRYFNHTEDESEFFILLVLRDRAGTKPLRDRFQKSIQEVLKARLNIKSRIKASQQIGKEEQQKFYSSYLYGAVHVLTSIPGLQSIDQIANHTGTSKRRIKSILEFLIHIGLVKHTEGKFVSTSAHVHLDRDSELVLQHHKNWRSHIISKLQFRDMEDIHYSACVSLSRSDVIILREKLMSQLKENVELISKSSEEVPYVLCFDFCKLGDTD